MCRKYFRIPTTYMLCSRKSNNIVARRMITFSMNVTPYIVYMTTFCRDGNISGISIVLLTRTLFI